MDNSQSRNHVWTTNNGFFAEHQAPQTPGNLSIRTTDSGQIRAPPNRTLIVDSNGNGNDVKHTNRFLNPTFIGVQSRFRRKYYHKLLLALLLLLIIILFGVIIGLIVRYNNTIEICHSNECVRTAANLIYSMDSNVDPCEDFYKFSCGNWANEHPRPDSVTSNDWFRERQSQVMRQVRQFLQQNITNKQPEAVAKAKRMYRSCMDTELLDKRKLDPLVHFLREFKLPLIPSGLNVTMSEGSEKKNANTTEFNWLTSLVLIKKTLGMDLIIGFDIFPDPFNRSINRIALGTPETDSALPFNNDDPHRILRKMHKKLIFNHDVDNDDDDIEEREEQEEESAKHSSSGTKAYIAYVKKIVELYLDYLNPDADESHLDELGISAGKLAQQAIKVARRIYKLKDDAENSTKPAKNPMDDIVYVSLDQLQNQTDKLITPKTLPIWQDYINLMMIGSNYNKSFSKQDLKIITSASDILYLQTVVEYLSQVPPSHIEFYIWLSAVEELILHTTSEMRLLHSEYMRLVIGTEGSTPRSIYCAHGIDSLMGMAVSYTLTNDEFSSKKLPMVHRMLNHIRQSFDHLVLSTSWMDTTTKRETLQKSAQMKSYIGYPEWITNASKLNAHYAGVKVNESTHLENMVGVLRWQMQEKLDNLFESESFGWATSPSNVNAFHTFQSNAITIPIAILSYPFYDLGLEALNYGSIGTVLGHELTHGFDDSGRMFDKNGNMLQWWSNETITEYVNRTECFVNQYNHYYLSDIGEYIDGELTLGENIADNGGMREAFQAYRLFVKHFGPEKRRLPGLERYTHEQLFFISFGNLWCETYTPAASRYALEDSHCPGKIRLKGVLSNSPEFAEAFHCRRGSGMNPDDKKCRIW